MVSQHSSERNDAPEQAIKRISVPCLALPDDEDPPPSGLQLTRLACVTLNVPAELLLPEVDSRLRLCGVTTTFMSMPEAPVNKNCGSIAMQNDVGPPGQVPRVQPESQATGVKVAAYDDLGLCVRRTNPFHHAGSGGGIDNVRHPRIIRQRAADADGRLDLVRS